MLWGSNGFVGLTQGGDFVTNTQIIENERRLINWTADYEAYWALLEAEYPSLPYPDPHMLKLPEHAHNPLRDLIWYDQWLQRKTSSLQSDGGGQAIDSAGMPGQWFAWRVLRGCIGLRT